MDENLPNDPIQPNEPTQPHPSFDVPDTTESTGIVLLDDAQQYLLTAGKWARFLGILGFIGTFFIAIMALFVGTIMGALSNFSPAGRAIAPAGFMSVFYILIAVFYFFVSLYLYQFGSKVRDGVTFGSSPTVTDGLEKLKSLFKLVGIATIVMLILYVLIVIGVILFASRIMHPSPSVY